MIDLDQVMAALDARHDRLEAMLSQLGWPLPGHLGSKWLDDVAVLFLEGRATADEVAQAFLGNYDRHGIETIRMRWSDDSLIAGRLPILLDGLEAHKEQRYNLSVPVFLAQLEGMIAEAKQHKDWFGSKALREYLQPIVSSGSRFEKIAARLVVDTLWSDFRHGTPPPPLSRNAILHGADVQYGTGANSLRAILYFDVIRKALSAKAA